MNLHTLLAQRTEASGPVKVGVIGAGKFASMFLTQALNLTGIHVVGVADLGEPLLIPSVHLEALRGDGGAEDEEPQKVEQDRGS